MITIALVVTALYFARDVLIPLALAVLFSFALAPLANRIQRLHVGRVVSVLFVVIVAFGALLSLFAYVATQLAQLAADLPSYQTTIQEKVQTLRGVGTADGTLARASSALQKIGDELNRPTAPVASNAQSSSAVLPADGPKPVAVEIHPRASTMLETLGEIADPLLRPIGTVGIIVVFLVFILLKREDLRDRLIRLVGSDDLQRTTVAIDDAATSLSKYFLAQVAVNTSFGIIVGIGLTIIGVPNPILWGTLAAVLRFIPYVGTLFAAALPVLVAAATDPGWALAIETAALILGLDLLVGQVVEPMLYGHTTGISPLAVVISATLWTILWGPLGLLIATPLTICLVVLGRHVDQLGFLDVILGDKPPLTPAQNFYQRLLASDAEEAAEQAETFMKDRPLITYYDEVALKGLELAQTDLSRGSLEIAKVLEIKATVEALVDNLSDHQDPVDPNGARAAAYNPVPIGSVTTPVLQIPAVKLASLPEAAILCIGGRSGLDDAGSLLLAQLLQRVGVDTRVADFSTLSVAGVNLLDPTGIGFICLSSLDVSSPAHLRFAVRRLRRRIPLAKVLIGCWGQDVVLADTLAKSAKADFSAASLGRAMEIFAQTASAGAISDEVPKLAKVA